MNGETSVSKAVTSGVPQGSVLGPLLFLIYINDITLLHLSRGTKLSLYADDMLLYKEITAEMDYTELQNDVNIVHHWTIINVMKFSKCKYMILSRKKLSSSHHDIDSRQSTLGINNNLQVS